MIAKYFKLRLLGFLLNSLSIIALAGCGGGLGGTDSGLTKYDGTYNFFFKYPSPSGLTSRTLARFLIIQNGVVSSSDGTVTGGTVDTFGAVRFNSPCPINSSVATWTGNMNASALSGANFGQGTYTCSIAIGGGSSDSWQATQS